MPSVVIDTNVLLIANGSHADVSEECRKECIKQLSYQQKFITVIDDQYRILLEYQNKTRPNQPKGVGDVFLKWLLRNQHNTKYVQQVSLNETKEHWFDEFPSTCAQDGFDPPDRKFVAVSNAHKNKPIIWQAADCKWLDWWKALEESGIKVKFLCEDDACKFYSKKFPKHNKPELPKP
jgi:hypothetical protein